MQRFEVRDIRNNAVFPQLQHRYSSLLREPERVTLKRDYLGENPLHYYLDINGGLLTVANNIIDIKRDLESQGRVFVWERVRAVNNNTELTFEGNAFAAISPREAEILPTLQEQPRLDCSHISVIGGLLRDSLQCSVETRLSTITDEHIGVLLSGGLDSMGIAYLLSTAGKRDVTAFTLKVDEDESDVTRSREMAVEFGINLVEVGVSVEGPRLRLTSQKYSPERRLMHETLVENRVDAPEIVSDSLELSGNPKRDNVLCAIAMNLIGRAVRLEGPNVVFCGEGPNEMINDYGYNPRDFGYPTTDKGDFAFRQALTFGFKKSDLQLGRGGLPKHALARMGKIFASHRIKLEAPYFEMDIARMMTQIPHVTSYDTVKQLVMANTFGKEKPEKFIEGTAKEKFQDGSGISRIFADYTQPRLLDIFEGIYGVRKAGYR